MISKKKYYRYRVPRGENGLSPVLDIDLLERFVNEREYEMIPEALPEGEDWGVIPGEKTKFDEVK